VARPVILIVGHSGQLATALSEAAAPRGLDALRIGRPALDFDRPSSITETFERTAPWLAVNAAAHTAVDAAEDDAEAAMRANRDGPAELARLCEATCIPLIHVSTDYVFDGKKGTPYVEIDPTAPQCVYGATKLAGEQAVVAACSRTIILRTSWLYSNTGKNFVRTMLSVGRNNPTLRVVADQHGCPTTAIDLAEAIVSIATQLADGGWQDRYGGIFHAAGTGATTWHGLATATFEAASRHGMKPPVVEPITTDQWPTNARRPPDSRLNCDKLYRTFGLRLPPWRDSLDRTVNAIFSQV
jgi:dTDP-4-dehydrorhamnose reductase